MLALCSGTALAVLDGAIVTVALPTLAHTFHVSGSAAVLVVTVYQLVLVMTLLPFSALGQRIGLRRLYQYGQLIFLISTTLCFFTRSLALLLVVRALQALGGAASLSVSTALIRSIYPHERLGRGLAVHTVVVSSSNVLAPVLGGLLLSIASWPWLFAAAAPLALVSLLLGYRTLPDPVARSEPYDVLAAVLCALTFGLIISGLESAAHGDSSLLSLLAVAAGAVLAIVFVRRELRSNLPILPVDLLGRPTIALSAASALMVFIGSMSFLLSLPFRLQQQFGYTPSQVGAIIAPWPLSIMLVAPLAGLLSDRFPAAILGGLGMGISALGLLLMAFIPPDVSHLGFICRMTLCGVGFGLFSAPNARLIVHSAPLDRAASAGGLISTTRLTGQTLGATLMAALLALGQGANRTPALVAAVFSIIACTGSLARLKTGTIRMTPAAEG